MQIRTKQDWEKVITPDKTPLEIAKECNVYVTTVYYAARKFNLKYKRRKDKTDFRGISMEVLKEECKQYTIPEIAKRYGVDQTCLRGFLNCRGISYKLNKDKQTAKAPANIKRTGEAQDMIRTLIPYYTDASIARVFGYTRERIRQLRLELTEPTQQTSLPSASAS